MPVDTAVVHAAVATSKNTSESRSRLLSEFSIEMGAWLTEWPRWSCRRPCSPSMSSTNCDAAAHTGPCLSEHARAGAPRWRHSDAQATNRGAGDGTTAAPGRAWCASLGGDFGRLGLRARGCAHHHDDLPLLNLVVAPVRHVLLKQPHPPCEHSRDSRQATVPARATLLLLSTEGRGGAACVLVARVACDIRAQVYRQ